MEFQIYFLVVVTHLMASLVLASPSLGRKNESFAALGPLLTNKAFQLIFGVVTVFAAVATLLNRHPGDVILLGDLLPASSGLLMGAYFIMSHFAQNLEENRSWMQTYVELITDHGQLIGMGTLIIGILHFLLPGVFFI